MSVALSTSVPATMRAAVLTATRTIALEERTVPVPGPGEVLVRVTAVGVCGSDVHYYEHGRIDDFVVTEPLVLGHEAGGQIVAVGSNVDPDRVGTRVSIEPQRPDPSSSWVLEGHYNLDPSIAFYATPPIDGAFAEYVTIQSQFAYAVPDSVSDEAAALFEPLSVGIAAARKARLTAGETVLIAGAGPIGLVTAQVARAYGATHVLVSEPDPIRRERALKFGATQVLAPDDDLAGTRIDVFVDASGVPAAISAGLNALRPGGRAVLVGMGTSVAPAPLSVIRNRELEVTGVFRYANTWPTARELVASGAVDLDRMVTARFPLAQATAALETSSRPDSIKVIVRP